MGFLKCNATLYHNSLFRCSTVALSNETLYSSLFYKATLYHSPTLYNRTIYYGAL